MEPVIKVVGTGPGDSRYITPLALEAIGEAQVLIGGRSQLQSLASPDQQQFVIGNNLARVVEFIKAQGGKRIVVLASGDSGLYSIGHYLARQLGDERLEFIPGISSVQLMFARLKKPWQDARILSLHGRSIDSLDQVLAGPGVVAVLTGGENTPQRLAARLLEQGAGNRPVALGQNLSYPDELLVITELAALFNDPRDYSNSVMVIFDEA